MHVFTYMELSFLLYSDPRQEFDSIKGRALKSGVCSAPRSDTRPKMSAVLIGCVASVMPAPLSLGLAASRVAASLIVHQRRAGAYVCAWPE